MTHVFAYLSVVLAGLLLATPGPAEAGSSFPISPAEAERRLDNDPFEILEAKPTASGVAGAQKWKLRFADGKVIKAKWKAAPKYSADAWNNSPRREIAAYEIQKWFLDPADYIVPTSEMRCIPLAVYREKVDSGAKPTLLGTDCVLGVLSIWLQDIEEPAAIWHPELFEQGGYYRFSIAATDVLTLLIGHQDGRPANFLWSADDRHQVFSIDNGISFHAFPFNPLVKNWNGIRVPALPKRVIERLDAIGPEQIAELAILRHMEPDPAGVLKLKRGAHPNLGPADGTRVSAGTVQIGLRQSELEEIEERIGYLLGQTESGKIPLF